MAAVDLGGTKLRVAIVDLAGTVVAEIVEMTHPEGGHAVARQIGALVQRATTGAGVDLTRIHQTVVGCPGEPDQANGRVNFAPDIAGIDIFGSVRQAGVNSGMAIWDHRSGGLCGYA